MANETTDLVLLDQETVARVLQNGAFTAQEKINITDGLALVTDAAGLGWIPGIEADKGSPISIADLAAALDRPDIKKLVVRGRTFPSFGQPRQRDLRKFVDHVMWASSRGIAF